MTTVPIAAPITFSPAQKTILFTLMLADDAVIHSHRLSEWCGHGPVLEQDIALTNIALDHLGAARTLYQYAADHFNNLPQAEKENLFSAPLIAQKLANGVALTEDDFPYLRDAWDYKNILLTEQHNHDFGYTIARCFFLDVFQYYFYSALKNSSNEVWSAVAEKSLKEVAYHLRWSSEWMIRLGDGTDESHHRIQQAVDDTWTYTGEMFMANEWMAHAALTDALPEIKVQWLQKVKEIFEEATLTIPDNSWMQKGGREGIHSEHLGYILADMQFMQRTYPGMNW